MALFQALGNEDPGGESFEELFTKMASMKGMPILTNSNEQFAL